MFSTKFNSFSRWQAFRYRLGEHDAVLPLSLLGALSGLITGAIIVLFRYAIDFASVFALSSAEPGQAGTAAAENFEGLSTSVRFFLPFAGAVVLGIIFQCLPKDYRYTGLNHVVVRLHQRNGLLPVRNSLVQFFTGIAALATGQSGGREGPAIHLGAAANSVIAKRLHLPANTMRILTACGAAAAIGASFNTPIAGVIFAMEVIIMEYTVVGFIPVILAAISATSLTQLAFGNEHTFMVPEMVMNSMWEFPFLLLLGLICGVAALLFMRIQLLMQKFQSIPVFFRFSFAGLVTGALGIYLPGVLGIGYDTVNLSLTGEISLQLLLMLCLAKILATAVTSGMGMPVGIVGPSLFIGAGIGGSLGFVGASLQPELAADAGFYALLGMGGMMGALLNAPLAALIAILELAHTPEALLPGIIVIVVAALCTDQIFGQRSAVENVLQRQGISLSTHPVEQALSRIGLSAVIDTHINYLGTLISRAQLVTIAAQEPRWIVIETESGGHRLISRKSFASYYSDVIEPTLDLRADSNEDATVPQEQSSSELIDAIRALDLPLMDLIDISISSTVTQGRQTLRESDADGLFIYDEAGDIKGILRKESLRKLIDNW